jgi:hypothetical protein
LKINRAVNMGILGTNSVVLSEKEFRQISDLVYQHCGINLHDGKKELVQARLAKWIREGNFKTFEESDQFFPGISAF